MAFTWCVRRSASRLASVYGNRMSRLRSISAVVSRPSLAPTSSPFRPFALYSTAIDRMSSEQSLLRVIDSEINTALQIDDPDLVKFTHFAWFVIKGIRKFAALCFGCVGIWTVLEWIALYNAFAFWSLLKSSSLYEIIILLRSGAMLKQVLDHCALLNGSLECNSLSSLLNS